MTPSLPQALYTAAQVRRLDDAAIKLGVSASVLMERAGASALAFLRTRWPHAQHLIVMTGEGNNAGDGFVLARLAGAANLRVTVMQVGDTTRLHGAALTAHQSMQKSNIDSIPFAQNVDLSAADVIVDALFGTGLAREVSGDWRAAIEAMNSCGKPVLALDIPSGLEADTGAVLGAAIKATATITFIGLKQGMFTAAGPDCCGELCFADLEVPKDIYQNIEPAAKRIDLQQLDYLLPPRLRNSHKGVNGHVLVIGGDHGMAGAVRLAGEAAARVGAGLVTIATRAAHVGVLVAARPELLCHAIDDAAALAPLVARADVIAVGPGLGTAAWGRDLWRRVLDQSKPLVVDADALNLLAAQAQPHHPWILTPHPGEAARLLGCTTQQVQQNRFAAIRTLQQRFNGIWVLKGKGTLIFDGEHMLVCSAGNPGMASGGMGDVLTGVIAGLVAQGIALTNAAQLGVCLHAEAGDLAAADGERGMLAGDLMLPLRRLVNPRGVET